jgi:DNA-binding NarL/FixJ family response regulator
MDVDMPGRACFEVAKEIRERLENTRVIFLSAFFNDRYIESALKAGAIGYVTKDEPPEMIVEAIRKATRGVSHFSSKVRSRLTVGAQDRVTLKSAGHPRIAQLTDRELELLRYLARGMSKKEISRVIHRSYNTVDKHIENLMTKLDIHDRVELARFAIREGLVEA